MTIFKTRRVSLGVALLALVLGSAAISSHAQAADKTYKVYLSMSYIGNDWQSEAKNMVTAMSKYYSDKVDFHVQVAGTNAQKQIQQINGMVQAGADAIIVYPISPNALNAVVRNACNRGVVVMAYDSEITESCAHNVTIDQHEAGTKTAQWLADSLDHKGNVVMVTGVPGTSVDKARTEAAMKVFKKYPKLNVIAKPNGMWSQAVARKALSQVVATHGWDNIDGLWMQVGCYTGTSMQIEAGIAEDKLRPCAGEASNGHRVQMLAAGTVKGESDTYKPVGLKSISYGSPIYSGALALKLALAKLEGQKKSLPHNIKLPLPLATTDQVKLCKTGSYKELADGCNVFDPSRVPPGWFSDIYSKDTPEVGFQAALNAKPEPRQ
ncbi:sugar ABC transporter substrate-binding protein [Salinisphaera sp. SPP-AMP-43]|uniref:sugar ABC transporter substrate-binding protein n=1 Tax=Salinisphaera sp. SPP-AMP-43 TaxID=3121288 RepID=UPI003C6DE4C8